MSELAYKLQADYVKALAHPIRIQIVDFLKTREQNVGSIVKALGIQQSSLSRHLTILKESGILRARQQGLMIYYGIEDPDIFKVLQPIRMLLSKKLKRTEAALSSLGKT